MKLPTNPENNVRIAHGIRHCGAFIFPNFVTFGFWCPYHPCTDGGEIWQEVSKSLVFTSEISELYGCMNY